MVFVPSNKAAETQLSIRINLNGVLGTDADRLLSPLDQGFVFGASVYETLRTYRGRPFLLERHLARLRESAASLSISLDVTDEEMTRRLDETLSAAANPESYIRIIVSAGVGEVDYRVGAAREPTTVILVKPLPEVPAHFYRDGVRVAVVSVVRNHPRSVSPRIKSSSLLNNLLAMREALSRGAEEAVMLTFKGEVAEGSLTNIFLVKGRVVKTPSVDVGILAGITRELVLRLMAGLGFDTEETIIFPDDLLRADEVFITGTTKEILPVTMVDDTRIGNGKPGPVTLAVLQAYRERAGADTR